MSWADRYRLIPFVSMGRSFAGCDCWGLVRLIYAEELNIELPSYGDVSAHDLAAKAAKAATEGLRWGKVDKPQCYDVVLMRGHGTREAAHCGVIAGQNKLLHTEEQTGPILQAIDDPAVARRVLRIGRHPAL